MEKIITYEQILKRSLILGAIFFVCSAPIMVVGILFQGAGIDIHFNPFLVIIIYTIFSGCSIWLLAVYNFIWVPYIFLAMSVFFPIVTYLLLGSVLFLLLKKAQWLTIRKFTVILVVAYVFINIICVISFFMWLASDL
jgi:hypothetical protein